MNDPSVVVTKITQNLDMVTKEELKPPLFNATNLPASVAPSKDFIEAVRRIEDAKKQPPPPTSHPTTPQIPSEATVKPVDLPIKLEYRYSGTCYTCHQPVETLLVDIDSLFIAIAWCNVCKKSLQKQKVKPLSKGGDYGDEQFKDRPTVSKTVRNVSQTKKIPVQD